MQKSKNLGKQHQTYIKTEDVLERKKK